MPHRAGAHMQDSQLKTARRRRIGGGTRSSKTLSTLSTVIAPTTVALTGILYLAGWTERELFLRYFGLSAGLFNEPLQATLARGYIPTFFGLLLIAMLGAVYLALAHFYARLILKIPHQERTRVFTLADRFLAPTGWATGVYFVLLVLLVGLIAGEFFATKRARDVYDLLDRNCAAPQTIRCARYDLAGARFTGVLLVQDNSRAAVATKSSVRLLANDKIESVTPVGPRPL